MIPYAQRKEQHMANRLPNNGDPENDDFPSGPKIGDTVPTFTLSDQEGRRITYEPDGQNKALILFHRSAAW
jgi:hypothetical protein